MTPITAFCILTAVILLNFPFFFFFLLLLQYNSSRIFTSWLPVAFTTCIKPATTSFLLFWHWHSLHFDSCKLVLYALPGVCRHVAGRNITRQSMMVTSLVANWLVTLTSNNLNLHVPYNIEACQEVKWAFDAFTLAALETVGRTRKVYWGLAKHGNGLETQQIQLTLQT